MAEANKPKTKTEIIAEYDLGGFKQNKQDMLVALDQTLGMIVSACKKAKVAKSTHFYWMQTDPEYAEKFELIKESKKDWGESQIYKAMAKGDTTMIIFFAKTQLRDRGYSERIYIGDANLQDEELNKLTEDELKARLAEQVKNLGIEI